MASFAAGMDKICFVLKRKTDPTKPRSSIEAAVAVPPHRTCGLRSWDPGSIRFVFRGVTQRHHGGGALDAGGPGLETAAAATEHRQDPIHGPVRQQASQGLHGSTSGPARSSPAKSPGCRPTCRNLSRASLLPDPTRDTPSRRAGPGLAAVAGCWCVAQQPRFQSGDASVQAAAAWH